MVVGGLRDGDDGVEQLRLLQIVADDFVLEHDAARILVEEELPKRQRAVAFVEAAQHAKLTLGRELDLIEDVCRDADDRAVTDSAKPDRNLRAAVIKFERAPGVAAKFD